MVSELKLTPEQREQIRTIEDEALFGWMRSARPAAPGGSSGAAMGTRDKRGMERIVAVLTEEQVRRWRAITGEALKTPVTLFTPPPAPFAASGPTVPSR